MSDVVRQTEIGLESHLLVQIAVLFKFKTFFQQFSKVLTEILYTIPTAKYILDFLK